MFSSRAMERMMTRVAHCISFTLFTTCTPVNFQAYAGQEWRNPGAGLGSSRAQPCRQRIGRRPRAPPGTRKAPQSLRARFHDRRPTPPTSFWVYSLPGSRGITISSLVPFVPLTMFSLPSRLCTWSRIVRKPMPVEFARRLASKPFPSSSMRKPDTPLRAFQGKGQPGGAGMVDRIRDAFLRDAVHCHAHRLRRFGRQGRR